MDLILRFQHLTLTNVAPSESENREISIFVTREREQLSALQS